MSEKRLTGRIARENIRLMQVPRPPQGVIEGFLALGDCSGIVSDVMDELGIPAGVVGASHSAADHAGPAHLSVRRSPCATCSSASIRSKARASEVNRMAEFEAHNLAEDGDVLVIDGVSGMSNMGGISAQTGKRAGRGRRDRVGRRARCRRIRDRSAIRSGRPSSPPSPASGGCETIEINGPVMIGGVRVAAGRSGGGRRHQRLLHPARPS